MRSYTPPGLMRLAVPRRDAKSRNSYWHMAKTIASGVGFTNAMLAEQGLLSLKHLCNELATPHGENTGRTA